MLVTWFHIAGLISRQISPKSQGHLQGSLTYLTTIASIVGSVSCTAIYSYTADDASRFTGAVFFYVAALQLVAGACAAMALASPAGGPEVRSVVLSAFFVE